jgi:hypothetical protein
MNNSTKKKEEIALSIGKIGKGLKKTREKFEGLSEAIADGYTSSTLRLYKKRGDNGEEFPCVTLRVSLNELISLQEFLKVENEKRQKEFDELYELDEENEENQ